MTEKRLGGVYVANVTPFRDDGTLVVDDGAYLEHVSWLSGEGIRGVVPFGTNGEGPSVSLEEKVRVLGKLFGRTLPLQVIPSVMQGNLPDTLRMVEVLNGYPAAAVLILPPYYFKPADAEGLKRFYEPILEASEHPVVAYHIPRSTLYPFLLRSWTRSRSGGSKIQGESRATRRPSSGRTKAYWWAPRTMCGRRWGQGRKAP